ncbi:transporter substrate-binding domain-containing protein [Pseudoduganella sp. LjRoot289]|uniref:substrate-binding periplasmic protein n=1 Tax=Pseudoduganella sp. LjRoot289 TaxID=3342314 RepID=UPI003ECD4001
MLRRLLMVFLMLLLRANQASAESYQCVSFEYPPLISQAPGSAEPSGFAVELVQRIFQQLGAEVTIALFPWERSMAKVRLGEADCVFTIYRSAERELFLDYSHELVIAQTIHLYARRNSGPSFNGDLGRIKGLRVGVVRQMNYGPKFEQARSGLIVDEAANVEQNFRKLAAGRVDLVPSNITTAAATLGLPGLRDEAATIIQLSPPIEIVPSFVGFSKRRQLTQLRDRFDSALKKFVQTTEYRHLLEKYQLGSGPDLPKAPAPAAN